MDEAAKALLGATQSGLPIEERPFLALGKDLSLSEDEVLARLTELKKSPIVRRLGGVFDSKRLGFMSTLIAMKVAPERLEEVAERICRFPAVTHSYERGHDYSLWFTLIAADADALERILEVIKGETGVGDLLDLRAERLYKIGVNFSLMSKSKAAKEVKEEKAVLYDGKITLDDKDRALIRELSRDIPIIRKPFEALALRVGLSEDVVIKKLKYWERAGALRRISVILRHTEAGFNHNAMGVWALRKEAAAKAGELAAGLGEVSHCYLRRSFPDWPYNFYAMIHGKTEKECEKAADKITKAAGGADHLLLYSLREFKKTSMRYFA
ncbi:MAG: AsnC family transcriptional regulator [Actinomycetota bacterium]|nr:AsnC family transcriptional regulator [Actinomycetota bacterium]